MTDHRLTTEQMANFVVDGYLRFDALIPDELNTAVLADLPDRLSAKYAPFLGALNEHPDQPSSGTPLDRCYAPDSAIGRVLALDAVQGIITSLVGPNPRFDHDFVHHLGAGHGHSQHLHVDAVIEAPAPAFDLQLFYFPHDVAPGGGGTRFVPGTHLRRARAETVAGYQHIVGEQHFAGPAGTVMAFHHGLWHAGQKNPSDQDRWLFKIRLNPTVPQVKLWNTDDFAARHNDPSDHIFATSRPDSVAGLLRRQQPWQPSGHEYRYELLHRIDLWRYLSGDDAFDVDYYRTRRAHRAQAGADNA